MPKLDEILRAKGYTDEDFEALKPLLGNARYRTSLEETLGEYESSAAAARKEADEWNEWHQSKAIPTIEQYMKEASDAKAEAAQTKARLKFLQDKGFAKLAGLEDEPPPQPQTPVSAPSGEFDYRKHNLVTTDDIRNYADQEGDAIAMAQDIAAEHFEIFGKPIKGFRELRKEAVAKKIPVQQLWEQKFDVPAKRAEIAAKQREAEREAIRKEEREKVTSELLNPMSRPPSTSTNPYTKRPDVAGKQPWELDANSRREERVYKHAAKLVQ